MDSNVTRPKPLKLYNALQIGYLRNEKKQKQRLKRFGYRMVPELSNREHLVAFHPDKEKLLYVSNGTDFSNSVDVQNDLLGLLGAQKLTRRREEEKNALMKAKQTLNPRETVIVGHSLGAQHSQYIASPEDKVIQYNPFITAGAKVRPNVHNYRIEGDRVSMFSSPENTTTLPSDTYRNFVQSHFMSRLRNQDMGPIWV